MNLERFTTDKEIADTGEHMMAVLATVKEFGLNESSFAFVVYQFGLLMWSELAKRKDLSANGEEETRMYGYGFLQNMLTKVLKFAPNKETEIFMIDYMTANREKLLDEALALLNENLTPPKEKIN